MELKPLSLEICWVTREPGLSPGTKPLLNHKHYRPSSRCSIQPGSVDLKQEPIINPDELPSRAICCHGIKIAGQGRTRAYLGSVN